MVDTKRICFDIETLATSPDAVVLSIGATWLDPYASKHTLFEDFLERTIHLTLDATLQWGRSTCQHTLEWWDKQSDAAKAAAMPEVPTHTILDAAKALDQWVTQHGLEGSQWFCRGPHFDATILLDLFGEDACPFRFYSVRDTRTLLDMFMDNFYDREEDLLVLHPELVKHRADHDAIIEAMLMQRSKEKFWKVDCVEAANNWKLGHFRDGESLLETLAV